MKADSVKPRIAATVVVVRSAPNGLEVLLLRRAEKGDHNSGAWVFPGGLIDAEDHLCHGVCIGLDDTQASACLGVETGGLDYYVAAIRECFEEAGLLFAVDEGDQVVNLDGELGGRLSAFRSRLNSGAYEFADFCRNFALRICADRLFYIGHWLTPKGRAKRFDTRFFLAVLPDGQTSLHDDVETVEQVWLSPVEALSAENTRRLMTPTRAMIEQLAVFADTNTLLDWARSPRKVACVLPRLATNRAGPCPILPGHPAWAEVGRLDPHGRGDAWCEIRLGLPLHLSNGVVRLSAGPTGRHTYLVDIGSNEWAAIDPGPPDEDHLDALIAAAPGPIRWIFLTEVETEQVDSAAKLQARTGAQVGGPLQNNWTAPGATLRVLNGPAANTMSYLLLHEKMLFAGAQVLPTSWLAKYSIEWIASREGYLVMTISPTEENI